MALDHLGELFVGFEPLPLQGGPPVIEKSPGPAFSLVVPELAEGFLEQVRCVQPFIRLEQCLQGHTSIHREVFPVMGVKSLLLTKVAGLLAKRTGYSASLLGHRAPVKYTRPVESPENGVRP